MTSIRTLIAAAVTAFTFASTTSQAATYDANALLEINFTTANPAQIEARVESVRTRDKDQNGTGFSDNAEATVIDGKFFVNSKLTFQSSATGSATAPGGDAFSFVGRSITLEFENISERVQTVVLTATFTLMAEALLAGANETAKAFARGAIGANTLVLEAGGNQPYGTFNLSQTENRTLTIGAGETRKVLLETFASGEAKATTAPEVIPLPAGLPLLLGGLGAFAVLRRKRTRAA